MAARRERSGETAFTMVEIAISLAIIGFALVAIIGVLPIGLNVQRDNREETIINHDATYLMDAIRSGARGLDNLTQSVIGITIVSNVYDVNAQLLAGPITNSYPNPFNPPFFTLPNPTTYTLINGERIIGLLSTPKYRVTPQGFTSCHVVAYVRALSGLAVEKFPQDNPDVRQDAFSYRLLVENLELPVPPDPATNSPGRQLTHNLRELRLSFRWPLLTGGKPGKRSQAFRTQVGGQVMKKNDSDQELYFFQPQDFVKAP